MNDLVNLTKKKPAKTYIGTIPDTDLSTLVDERKTYQETYGDIPWDIFVYYWEVCNALRDISLDVRGGIAALRSAYISAKQRGRNALPITALVVTDAVKVCKYINLGVHIGTDVPEHPSTLAEAAVTYGKISALVSEDIPLADLDKAISNNQDQDEVWALKRIRFRVATRERYRQILLDMAREEWLEDQVSSSFCLEILKLITLQLTGLREKKRARLE